MKPTPYTTKTGIQIGCNYEPKQTWETSADMERLQCSLLDPTYRPTAETFWDMVLWVINAIIMVMLIIGVHYVG
jgi:hypothetical protein